METTHKEMPQPLFLKHVPLFEAHHRGSMSTLLSCRSHGIDSTPLTGGFLQAQCVYHKNPAAASHRALMLEGSYSDPITIQSTVDCCCLVPLVKEGGIIYKQGSARQEHVIHPLTTTRTAWGGTQPLSYVTAPD